MVDRRMYESIRALDYGTIPAGVLRVGLNAPRERTQEAGGASDEKGGSAARRTRTEGAGGRSRVSGFRGGPCLSMAPQIGVESCFSAQIR
jgi:hypothetical protein